jgi:hypothetical protein
LTDLEAIVHNFDDFKSTTYYNKHYNRFKYLVQVYNLGYNESHQELKNGKMVIIKNKITPNDKISVKSLLFLPNPIIKYSQVDLPGTNILQRSQLSQNHLYLFRLFKKSLEISGHVIENLLEEKDTIDKSMNNNNIQEYSLDYDTAKKEINNETRFKKFLNVIIPNNKTLIHYFENYIHHKYNLVDIVKMMEPFLIYTDNITYTDHNEIRYFIKQQMKDYIIKNVENSKNFALLKNTKYNINIPSQNSIDLLLKEEPQIYEYFLEYVKDNYLINKEIKQNDIVSQSFSSSSEELFNIINIDNGILFSKLMSYMLLSLVTPTNLSNMFRLPSPPVISSMDEEEKIKMKNCSRRFIAKRYNSLDTLQKDNGKLVVFDKEFDDTPYDIMKLYADYKKKMNSNELMGFLKKAIVEKHNCPSNLASRMALSLTDGRKTVLDGEYAILELKPVLPKHLNKDDLNEKEKREIEIEENIRKKTQYYRRASNRWVLDNDIEKEAFFDTNELFCNSMFDCHKNTSIGTCETTEFFKYNIAKNAHQKVLNEFNKRIDMTFEELQEELNKEIHYCFRSQKKNKRLRELLLYKSNYIAFDIGRNANTNEIIHSPYKKYYDMIVSQEDFSKKQNDIVRFYNKFCREPLIDKKEDPYWGYCKETNIKLLPLSIYQLAFVFNNGGNYKQKLDELCNQIGEISEDGDCIVDKHCKCVLRMIDFISEDGYDESGFKIISNNIIQKDIGTIVAEAMQTPKLKRVYENEITQSIFNILDTLCNNMSIPIECVIDFVLNTVTEIINNTDLLIDEKKYLKYIEKEKGKTKGPIKSLPPYDMYKNKIIITSVSSVLLIAIQTLTPSLKIRKTFPGCIQSFEGYPMEGIENINGIKYIACVVNNTKSSISPWNSIFKTNVSKMEEQMKTIIEKYIITRTEIIELYNKKREYILLYSESIIPEEHNIIKWTQFTPPLVHFSVVKHLENTTAEFDNEFFKLIKNGHTDQRDYLNIYRSKITRHSYAIIENINQIVKKKDLLLKTMSKVPFLENACCNEITLLNPISYFINNDPTIKLYMKRCSQKFSTIISDVVQISKASFLYNEEFTGFIRPIINETIVKSNIYNSFIHYCNFENNKFIPEDLETLVKEKPPSFKSTLSIEEKIMFLEKHGKKYNENDLHSLMNIINKRNLIDIYIPKDQPTSATDFQHSLKDMLNYFDLKQSELFEEPLRKLLYDVLNTFDPAILTDIKDNNQTPFFNATTKLKNYLAKSNEKMFSVIIKFIDDYGNLSNIEFERTIDFIENIMKWKKDDFTIDNQLYNDSALHTITQFIKNSIYQMTKVFPNVILNSVSFHNIPSYEWNLSTVHVNNIIEFVNKYGDNINKFKEDKSVFTLFLQNVQNWSADINMFIQNIHIENPIIKNSNIDIGKQSLFFSLFDKKTIFLLFQYSWYSTLYEFIQTADDPNLLNIDLKEKKNEIQNKIYENNNISNSIISINSNNVMDIDNEENSNELNNQYENYVEIEILTGDKSKLKSSVCSLLLTFISIDQQNKKFIDLTYNDINTFVNKTKKQEKDIIISSFEKMGKSERDIEGLLKKFKLDKWNVGTHKSIFQYDKNMYEEQAPEMMKRMFSEINDLNLTNEFDNVALQTFDTDDLNNAEQDEFEQNIYREFNNISDLNEDYTDGNYYEEDRDDDDEY